MSLGGGRHGDGLDTNAARPRWLEPLGFAALNLRFNPFGEPDPDERAGLAVAVDDVCALAQSEPCLVQVIGDSGHGKSTHLRAIAARLGGTYCYVPRGEHQLDRPLPVPGLLCLDEAQRLAPPALLRILRGQPRLLLGTHWSLAGFAWIAGRRAQTKRLTALSAEKLARYVAARLEWARARPGPVLAPPPELLRALHQRHRACIRSIEAELYDHYQLLQRQHRSPHAEV